MTQYVDSLSWSPDSRQIAYGSSDREIAQCELATARCRRWANTTRFEWPVQWSDDGNALYLQNGAGVPAHVVRYELSTGVRTPWLTLAPADLAGFGSVDRILLARDGKTYAYNGTEISDSSLFVVDGLR